MKTLHRILGCGNLCGFFPLALLSLGWMLTGTNALAATISWSGAGGDFLWSNPANWNGGALPTSADDVVINVPGAVTVRMDTPSTVRSLQCQESFFIEYGPFSVTSGPSFVNGSFNMGYIQELYVNGPATTFTAHGVVTNLAGLIATGGSVISLPNARQVEAIVWTFSTTATTGWSASGSGSVIEMVNLTNLVGVGSTYRGRDLLNATDGGRIDLHQLRSTEGDIGVGAANPASVIDLSGLEGLWPPGPSVFGLNSRLTTRDGGTIHIPNVTALDRVDLNISDSGNVPTAQLHSFTGGTLSLTSRTNGLQGLTNFSGSIEAYDTRLDLTNVTYLYVTNGNLHLSASQGSVIDLSRATNVVTTSFYALYATVRDGSRIDLRGLPAPEGLFYVDARGASSLVDLSGFSGAWHGYGNVRVWDGASVLIPNVTTLSNISLDLSADAIVPTVQLRSFTGGMITLTSRTNGFAGLTNFSGQLNATDTRLDLTNLTVLYATNSQVYLAADQGSFIDLSRVTNVIAGGGYVMYVFANRGSRIDLSGLVSKDAPINADIHGAGTLIDLSGLSGVWGPSSYGSLRAWDGATILMPNVTALNGVSLDVDGSASVNLAQLTSITAGSITLRSRTNDLPGLTNFTGSLTATDAKLYLTNLTALYVTNHVYINANQGGLIDLSHVTNVVRNGYTLYLFAYSGGHIDLSGLRVPDTGPLQVDAQHEGSLVDFSGFSGLWDAHDGVSVTAQSGTAVAISNVTAMRNISLNLIGDASVPVAQLRSIIGGSVRLQSRTNVFTGLTNFASYLDCNSLGRAEFPSLTELNTTSNPVSFSASSGGVIELSQVTNAVVETYGLSLSASYGGRIEIPNLETIVAGSVTVSANGTDAIVDLSGLTGFFSDNNGGSLHTANGGTILLNPDAMLLAGVAIDFQSNPGGVLPPFLAPSQSLVLYGQPWRSYRIESRNPLDAGSPWQLYKRVPLTEALQLIGTRPPKDLALRVHAFIADPPEVDLRLPAASVAENILFGVPDQSYRLESTTSLNTPIDWEHGPTVTLTNSFFIFPSASTTNNARFYRARKL